MLKNIGIIINSTKKIPIQIDDFLKNLSDHYICKYFYTEYEGHSVDIAKSLSYEDYEFVLILGGDGTISQVVNGLKSGGNSETTILIIPLGTGNDFCRAQKLTLPVNTTKFRETHSRFDLGKITIGVNSSFFINVMDVGLGGLATKILNDQRKIGIVGNFSYSIAIIRAFFSYKRPVGQVFIDDEMIYQGEIMSLAVCNSSTFGNGLIINPFANPKHCHLDVTLIGKVSLLDYLKNLPNLKKGNIINHPQISYHKGHNVKFKKISGNVYAQADGELLAQGDLNVEIIHEGIKIGDFNRQFTGDVEP